MTSAIFLLFFSALVASPGADIPGLLGQSIDTKLAKRAATVEMVYSDGKFSHLEYGFSEEREPASPTPTGTDHRIVKPRLAEFGACSIREGTLQRNSRRPCGFIVDISDGKLPINLLSFDTLSIAGKSRGQWTVALADDRLAAREENYPVGKLQEGGLSTFPLDKAAGELDLKRMKYLIFILASNSGELQIEQLGFSRKVLPPLPLPPPALWVWDNRPATSDAPSMVRNLKALNARRIYLQIGDNLGPLLPFLEACRQAGIEVFALDGAPSYLDHPDPLLARVRDVMAFNTRHPDTPFAGFQIDIEPHLNRDFRLRLGTYGTLYIELLNRIAQITEGKLPLSTVIPFWYDTLLIDNRTLAWHLIRQSDEAVIMSYRTDGADIEAIAREELLYGERLSKRVLLGVETGRIPDELHVTFRKCREDALTAIAAGGAFWCQSSDYKVPGSKISFMGKEEALKKQLSRTLPYRSFSGWVIHSYETVQR